jgi:hypothetical protein
MTIPDSRASMRPICRHERRKQNLLSMLGITCVGAVNCESNGSEKRETGVLEQ